jgi:secretory lipase
MSESSEPRGKQDIVNSARWLAAVIVLALAAGTLWVSHTLRSGTPVVDAFYSPPDSIPSEPGELLRSEPYTGDLPDGVSAWRILYTTTDLDEEPALSSGVVAVPESTSPEPPPVIAWAHGTVGIARACAPSLTPTAISPQAVPALDAVLRNGWAVVGTDYPGMGTAGNMPYLVGEGEGRSVLDSIRAAHQLSSVTLSDETVVWEHSQGGHAVLWTAQIAPTYVPEIHLLGTAALAPGSHPVALVEDISSKGPLVGIVLSFVLIS